MQWLLSKGFAPQSHITLTFDLVRLENVSIDKAFWWWRWLVRQLNVDLGGGKFRRKWGHSYFSYLVGIEHHKSGVVHMHALVDTWVDFTRIHRLWNARCGFAWIKRVDDVEDRLAYALKYVVKEDVAPAVWFQPKRREVLGQVRLAGS